MRPEAIARIIDGGIPIVGGLYATLLGHRVIGKRPGESPKFDRWHRRFGTMCKILGPVLIVGGVFQIVRGLIKYM